MIIYGRFFRQIKKYFFNLVTVNLLSMKRKKQQKNIVSLVLFSYVFIKCSIYRRLKSFFYQEKFHHTSFNKNLVHSVNCNIKMKEFEDLTKDIFSTDIPVVKKLELSRLNSSFIDDNIFPNIEIKPIEQPIIRDRMGTNIISAHIP